jgi:hypothetical protein
LFDKRSIFAYHGQKCQKPLTHMLAFLSKCASSRHGEPTWNETDLLLFLFLYHFYFISNLFWAKCKFILDQLDMKPINFCLLFLFLYRFCLISNLSWPTIGRNVKTYGPTVSYVFQYVHLADIVDQFLMKPNKNSFFSRAVAVRQVFYFCLPWPEMSKRRTQVLEFSIKMHI